MRTCLSSILLLCLTLASTALAAEKPGPDEEALKARARALIAKLGHDDWKLRKDAEVAITALGQVAVPLLKEAADRNGDPEVRLRAQRLVDLMPAEVEYQSALTHLQKEELKQAREKLTPLVHLTIGRYAEKARFLLKEINDIRKIVDMEERGASAFRQWNVYYSGEDKNEKILGLGIGFNNLYLFLLAESQGKTPVSAKVRQDLSKVFERSEYFYQSILEEEMDRKNRRVASCYAALLSAAGRWKEGRKVLARVQHIPPTSWLDFFDLASFWAYAGDKKEALSFLRMGFVAAEESGYLSYAKHWARISNDFQSLRESRAFKDLVKD